ncbi:SDR family oxidoreductase [Flavobacterium marginilacus]|uniref:SDR family oxidoreductase n=1 Tax=Flavobacterium marginilacus TaxID=3003256 RepID=UPI00248F2D63|nr:SDR family NAD(P)-dependent oxidoreductase [Flavobacterium marginilacus]
MDIQGKTVLITGGASGIGFEATKQFLKNGAKVIITGRNQDKLNAAKQQFPELIALKSDVSKAEDANALFEKVSGLGGIDILFNNAGVGVPPINLGVANDKHLAGAVYEMEVNYFGVIRLNNLFMDMLQSRREAAIINTTSILSIVPSVLEATYSATKAALAFYTKSLRSHLQAIQSSVKVFELLPPLVDTDMVADRPDKKMSPEKLVDELIKGLRNDTYTIRVGDTKALYFLNRLMPETAYKMVNKKEHYKQLK